MSRGDSTSNESVHFADLLRDVKPLRSEHLNQAEHYASKPEPIPRETLEDQRRVIGESLETDPRLEDAQSGDSLSFCRSGIQKNIFRKLKKGHYNVGAELDLHGMTVAEAQFSLARFIQTARAANMRCIRIIHGKGYGSGNKGPKLKPMVNQWLQKRNEILAFCSARASDGGTGAVYVLLKSL